MKKKNIVLVEHDKTYSAQINRAIKYAGLQDRYNIITSSPNQASFDAEGLVKEYTQRTVQIIKMYRSNIEGVLVDLRFFESDNQDMSGIEIATNIKSTFPSIPVLIITNHWGASDMLRFGESTLEIVDGVLPKSFFTGNHFTAESIETIFEKARKKIDFYSKNQHSEIHKDNKEYIEADIAVITALRKPEHATFREHFPNSKRIPKKNLRIPDSSIYHLKTRKIRGKEIRIVSATDDIMGMPAATSLATRIIYQFNPKIIVILGIAAGIEGRTNIGDIMIAEYSWDYGSGKNKLEKKGGKEESTFIPYSKPYPANDNLIKEIQDYLDKSDLGNRIKQKTSHIYKNDRELKIHIEPFASGSAVIANRKKVYEIQEQNGKLIGFDMESYGVNYAAMNCNNDVYALSIKAVSDFGTESKDTKMKDQHQQYAASNSVLGFKYLLENALHKTL